MENNTKNPNTTPLKSVDAMKLYLTGMTLDKAKELSGNPDLTLTFDNNFESSFKKWQPAMEKVGASYTKEEYKKVYDQAKKDFTQKKIHQKNEEDIFYWQRPTSPIADNLIGYNASRSYDLGERNSPFGFTNSDGKSITTRTDTEVLHAQNTFIDKDGVEQSLTMYKALHANGNAFRKDGDDELMLTINRDMNGNPFYSEAKTTDVIKNSMIASLWGPQKMSDSYMSAFGSSMMNALTDAFIATPGSLSEWVGNSVEFFFGEGSGDKLQAVGNQMQNLSAINKSKMSYATENAKMFDGSGMLGINGRALSSGMGSLVGQIIPIMAGGYIGGALGTAMRLNSASLAFKTMQYVPSIGWASAFAADAFNQEAKEMGVSQNARAALYPAVFAITAMTEAFVGKVLGGKNLAEGFGLLDDVGEQTIKQGIREELGDLLADGSQEAQKSFLKRVGSKFAGWMESTKSSRVGNMLSSGFEESSEEFIQGVAENSVKRFHDFVNRGTLDESGNEKVYGSGLMTNDEFSYFDGWKENVLLGFLGGAVPGVFHKGQKASDVVKGAVHAHAAIELGLSRERHKELYDEVVGERGGYKFLNEKGEYIGSESDERSGADVARDLAYQQIDLVHDIVAQLKENGKGNAKAVAEMMGGDNALFREAVTALFTAKQYENDLNNPEKQLDDKTRAEYQSAVEKANKHADDILSGKLYGEYLSLSLLNAESFNEAAKENKTSYSSIDLSKGLIGRENLRNAAALNTLYNQKLNELGDYDAETIEQYYQDRTKRDELIRKITNKNEKGEFVEDIEDVNKTLTELNTVLSNTSISIDEIEAVKERFTKEMAKQINSLLEGTGGFYDVDASVEDIMDEIAADVEEGPGVSSIYGDKKTDVEDKRVSDGVKAVNDLLTNAKSFSEFNFQPKESNRALDAAADFLENNKTNEAQRANLNQVKKQLERVQSENGLNDIQKKMLKDVDAQLAKLDNTTASQEINVAKAKLLQRKKELIKAIRGRKPSEIGAEKQAALAEVEKEYEAKIAAINAEIAKLKEEINRLEKEVIARAANQGQDIQAQIEALEKQRDAEIEKYAPINNPAKIIKDIFDLIWDIADKFNNTSVKSTDDKLRLLMDDIKMLVDDYGVSDNDVKDFMKTQGSTLIKEVWRKDPVNFSKLINAWNEGKIAKNGITEQVPSENEINAKYDAQIAALKATATNQSKTKEEVEAFYKAELDALTKEKDDKIAALESLTNIFPDTTKDFEELSIIWDKMSNSITKEKEELAAIDAKIEELKKVLVKDEKLSEFDEKISAIEKRIAEENEKKDALYKKINEKEGTITDDATKLALEERSKIFEEITSEFRNAGIPENVINALPKNLVFEKKWLIGDNILKSMLKALAVGGYATEESIVINKILRLLMPKKTANYILFHEAVHVATLPIMYSFETNNAKLKHTEKEISAYNFIKTTYESIIAKHPFKSIQGKLGGLFYGLSDIYEFQAEFMANPRFRTWIKNNIDTDNNKESNIIKKITKNILLLLGINTDSNKSSNLLNQLDDAMNTIFEAQAEYLESTSRNVIDPYKILVQEYKIQKNIDELKKSLNEYRSKIEEENKKLNNLKSEKFNRNQSVFDEIASLKKSREEIEKKNFKEFQAPFYEKIKEIKSKLNFDEDRTLYELEFERNSLLREVSQNDNTKRIEELEKEINEIRNAKNNVDTASNVKDIINDFNNAVYELFDKRNAELTASNNTATAVSDTEVVNARQTIAANEAKILSLEKNKLRLSDRRVQKEKRVNQKYDTEPSQDTANEQTTTPTEEAELATIESELAIINQNTPQSAAALAKLEALKVLFAEMIGETSKFGSSFLSFIEDTNEKAIRGQIIDPAATSKQLHDLLNELVDFEHSLAINNQIQKSVAENRLPSLALKALRENHDGEIIVDAEHLLPYLKAVQSLKTMLATSIQIVNTIEDIRDKNLQQIKDEYQAIEFGVVSKIAVALGIPNKLATSNDIEELIAVKEKIRQKIEKEGVLSIIEKKKGGEQFTSWTKKDENFEYYSWTKELLKAILGSPELTDVRHYDETGLTSDVGNFTKKEFDEKGQENPYYFTAVHNILLQTLGLNHTQYHQDLLTIHNELGYGLTIEQDLVLRSVSAWDNLIAQKETKDTKQSSLHYVYRAMRTESKQGFAFETDVYPDNIIMIDGIAGGGKSFVLSHIFELMVLQANRRGEASPIQVVLSAQSAHLRNELEAKLRERQANSSLIKDIQVEIVVEDLATMIGNIADGTHKGKIILSDEVSLFKDDELNAIIQKNEANRIVFFGDLSQMEDITGSTESQLQKDALFKTWKITQSNRTGLESLAILQDQFRLGQLTGYNTSPVIVAKTNYFDNGKERRGVRMFTNDDDIISHFVERVKYYETNGLDTNKLSLIVVNEHERQKAIAKGVLPGNIKTLSRGDNSVQGMTLDEAYVLSIPAKTVKENGKDFTIHGKDRSYVQYNKMMLTAITRPTSYLAFVNEVNRSKELKRDEDIPNRIYKKSDLDKMNATAKNRHKEQLNEIEATETPVVEEVAQKPTPKPEPIRIKPKAGETPVTEKGKKVVKKEGDTVVADKKGKKKKIKKIVVKDDDTLITFDDDTTTTGKELESINESEVTERQTVETTAQTAKAELDLYVDNITMPVSDKSFAAVVGHVQEWLKGKEFGFKITRNKERLVRNGTITEVDKGFEFRLELNDAQQKDLKQYLESEKVPQDIVDDYINNGFFYGGYSETSDLGKALTVQFEKSKAVTLYAKAERRDNTSYNISFTPSNKPLQPLVKLFGNAKFLFGKKFQIFQNVDAMTDTVFAVALDSSNIGDVYEANKDKISEALSKRRGISIDGVLFIVVKPKVIVKTKAPAFFDAFFTQRSETNLLDDSIIAEMEHFLEFNRGAIKEFLNGSGKTINRNNLITFGTKKGENTVNVNITPEETQKINDFFDRINYTEKEKLFDDKSESKLADKKLLFDLFYNYLMIAPSYNINLRYHTLKVTGEDIITELVADTTAKADTANILYYLETPVISLTPTGHKFTITRASRSKPAPPVVETVEETETETPTVVEAEPVIEPVQSKEVLETAVESPNESPIQSRRRQIDELNERVEEISAELNKLENEADNVIKPPTLPTIKGKVSYVSTVTADGFLEKNKSSELIQGASLYKFVETVEGQEGYLEIIDTPYSRIQLTSTSLIRQVFDPLNQDSYNVKLNTFSRTKVRREGDKWVIVEKEKGSFSYGALLVGESRNAIIKTLELKQEKNNLNYKIKVLGEEISELQNTETETVIEKESSPADDIAATLDVIDETKVIEPKTVQEAFEEFKETIGEGEAGIFPHENKFYYFDEEGQLIEELVFDETGEPLFVESDLANNDAVEDAQNKVYEILDNNKTAQDYSKEEVAEDFEDGLVEDEVIELLNQWLGSQTTLALMTSQDNKGLSLFVEFKRLAKIKGRELFGLTQRAGMPIVLATVNGKVQRTTPFHEVIHFVHLNLVDNESQMKLYELAYEISDFKTEGLSFDEVMQDFFKRKALREVISEQGETYFLNQKNKNKFEKALSRFVSWVKFDLIKVANNLSTLDNFYQDLYNGGFRKASNDYLNGLRFSTLENSNEDYKDYKNIVPSQKALGNSQLAFKASTIMADFIFNSPYYNSISHGGNFQISATHNDILAAVQYASRQMLKVLEAELDVLINKDNSMYSVGKTATHINFTLNGIKYSIDRNNPLKPESAKAIKILFGGIKVKGKFFNYQTGKTSKVATYAEILSMPNNAGYVQQLLTKENFNTNKNHFALYTLYAAFSSDRVFKGLLERQFNNLDITLLFEEGNDNLIGKQDSIDAKDAGEVNPMDKASDIIKNILFATKTNFFDDNSKKISPVIAARLITSFGNMAHHPLTADESGLAKLELMRKRIEDYLAKGINAEDYAKQLGKTEKELDENERNDFLELSNGSYFKSVQSFYNRFFNTEVLSYNGYKDIYALINQGKVAEAKALYNQKLARMNELSGNDVTPKYTYFNDLQLKSYARKHKLADNDAAFVKIITDHHVFSSSVLSALGKMSYGNFDVKNLLVKVRRTKYGVSYTPTFSQSSSDAAMRDVIADNIAGNFTSGNVLDALKAREIFVSQKHWLPNVKTPNPVTIESDGIYFNGKKVVDFEYDSRKQITGLKYTNNAEIDRRSFVMNALANFGLRSMVDSKVEYNLSDDNGEVTFGWGFGQDNKKSFLNSITVLMMSAYTFASRDANGELKGTALDFYNYLNGTVSNNSKYGKETFSSIMNRDTEENNYEGEREKDFFFPTAFFNELNVIATGMAMSGSRNNSFHRNAVGSKVFDRQVGNQLSSDFGIDEKGRRTNAGLIRTFEIIASGKHDTHNIRGNQVINEFLRKGGIKVLERYTRDGFSEKGRKGKEYFYTTLIDQLDYLTETTVDRILRGGNDTVVMDENEGDRKTQDINIVDFRTDKTKAVSGQHNGIFMFKRVEDGKNIDWHKSITMDYDNIINLMKSRFEVQLQAQVNSLNRVISFVNKSNRLVDKKAKAIPSINISDDLTQMYSQAQIAINTLNPMLKKMGKLSEEDLAGYKIYTNKDIIIGKNGVELGKDATFNSGDRTTIYNKENFEDFLIIEGGIEQRALKFQIASLDTIALPSKTAFNETQLQLISDVVYNMKGEDFDFADMEILSELTPKLEKALKQTKGLNQTNTVSPFNESELLYIKSVIEGYKTAILTYGFASVVSDVGFRTSKTGVQYTAETTKKFIVRKYFTADLEQFSRFVAANGYTIPKKYGKYKNISDQNGRFMHPLFEGMYYSHHFYNEFMLNALVGTQAEFNGVVDKNKRLTVIRSPHSPFDTSNDFGVDRIANSVLVNDKEVLAKYYNKDNNSVDNLEMTNGLAFVNPVARWLLHHSAGQAVGANSYEASMKDVQFQRDFADGKLTIRKRSVDNITETMIKYDLKMKAYLERMLNPDNRADGGLYGVFEKFRATNSFKEAARLTAMEYVKDRSKYEMDYFVEFTSANKGKSKYNVLDVDKYLAGGYTGENFEDYRNKHDFSQGGVQLEPFRDTSDTKETKPSQIMNIILGTPFDNATSMKIQNTLAEIGELSLEEMISEFNDIRALKQSDPQAYRKKLKDYTKKLLISSMQSSTENSNIANIINDMSIGIDFPAIEVKAVQYIANEISKKAIKFKMPGMRLNESKIDAELYDYNGLVWTEDELVALKGKLTSDFDKAEIDKAFGKKRGLKSFRYIIDKSKPEAVAALVESFNEQLGTPVTTANIFNYIGEDFKLTDSGQRLVINPNQAVNSDSDYAAIEQKIYAGIDSSFKVSQKAELLAPAHQFKKLNIPSNTTLNELMTVVVNGQLINLRDEIQNVDAPNVLSPELQQMPIEAFTAINPLMKGLYAAAVKEAAKSNGNAKQMAYRELLKKVKAVDKSIGEILVVRTPSSNASSGSYSQIVGFVNDNGNNLYSSPERMLLDGHDNDIDQATLYFLTEEEEMNEIEKLKQSLVANLFTYYKNPEHDIYTMRSIDLSELRRLSQESVNEAKATLSEGNLGTSFYNKSAASDGKIVGPFANLIKVISNVVASGMNLKNSGNALKGSNQSFTSSYARLFESESLLANTVAVIGDWANAATDNAKELIHGVNNVSINNAAAIGAMLINQEMTMDYVTKKNEKLGIPPPTSITDAIIQVLKSKAHTDLVNKMDKYKSVREGRSSAFYKAAVQYWSSLKKYEKSNTEKLSKLKEEKATTAAELLNLENSNKAKFGSKWNLIKELQNIRTSENKAKKKLFRKYGKNLTLEAIANGDDIDSFIDPYIKEYEEQLDEGRKDQQSSTKIKEELNAFFNAVDANKDVKELGKRHTELKNKLDKINNQIVYYEGFGDDYKEDLFFLAKMGLIGEANNNLLSIFGLDQGTPVYEHEMSNDTQKIEYIFGMPFDDIFDYYEKYRKNPQAVLSELANKYDERIEYSKKVYKNRVKDGDINKEGWRIYEINHEVTSIDEKGKIVTKKEVINYERDIHKVFDVVALVFSRPDLMFQLKALRLQNTVINDSFFNNHEIHKDFMKKIASENGLDVLTDKQFYLIKSELENYYIDKFLKTEPNGLNGNFGSNWRNDFGPELISEHGTYVDLSSAPGRQAFLRDFPSYFSTRVEELQRDPFYKNNQFINQLEINHNDKIPFLQFKNPYNIDDAMMADIAADFEQLPGKMKGQIAYYQLVKDGFDHRKGGFSKVLDGVIFRQYSKFISNEQSKIDNSKIDDANSYRASVVNDLNTNFISYLRSNTKLSEKTGLVKYYSDSNATLDYLIKEVKVADRIVTYLLNMEAKTLEIYRYPNIGLPYDGDASNVIKHELKFTDEGEIDLTNVNSHPIFSLSKDEHEANIDAYFDVRKGEKSPVLSITFSSDQAYKAGQTLYLSDGFIGTVVGVENNVLKYTLNPYIEQTGARYIENTNEYNLMEYMNNQRVSQVIKLFINGIRKTFPNIQIKEINSKDLNRDMKNATMGAKSFIHEGVLYILTDKVTPDALIEEYGHLWGFLLEQQSEADFNAVTNSFIGTALSASVMKRYGYEEGSRMWKHEVFAQAIRVRYLSDLGSNDNFFKGSWSLKKAFKNEAKVSEKTQRSVWKRLKDAINNVITTIIGNLFTTPVKLSDKNIFNLGRQTTMEDISMEVFEALVNGVLTSKMTSEQIKERFNGEFIQSKDFDLPEMKNIGINDLANLFQQTFPDSDQKFVVDDYYDGIYKNLTGQLSSESDYIFYNDLSDGSVTRYSKSEYKSDADLKRLATELANQQYEKKVNQNALIGDFFQLMSEGVELKRAAELSFRKSYDETEDELLSRQLSIDLSRMVNMLNYNPNSDLVLNSKSASLKRFGIELSEEFQNDDTFLIIHADKSISIFRLSPFSLNSNGESDLSILNEILYDENGNIVEKIIDKQAVGKLNLSLTQSKKHIQAVQNILLAMELKRQNKDVKINTLTSLNIYTKINKDGRGFDWYSDTMENLLPQVEKVFSIEPIRNALSPELKRLVTNKALFDKKAYDQNPLVYFMQSLKGFVDENSTKQTKSVYDEIEAKLSAGIKPGDSANYRVMHLIRKRLDYLDKRYVLEQEELTRNLEYRLLMEAYDYINNYHRSVSKSLTDINTIAKWIREPNKYENELLQYLVQEVDATNANIEEYVHQHNVVHNKKVTAIMEEKGINRQMTILDRGQDIFGRLFKTEKGRNKKGEEVIFYNNEIHHDVKITYDGQDVNANPELRNKWLSGEITAEQVEIADINDSETFALYRSGDLSKTELLYGKWVMDTLEQSFLNTIIYEEGVDGKDSEERRNNALKKLNSRWKKGMLPVMPERFSAALTKLLKGKRNNAAQALKAFARSVAKFDSVFDEASKEQQELHDISNPFLAQFTNNNAERLGSEYRARKIGVHKSITPEGVFYDWYTGTGVQNNESMSQNIQDLLNYSVLASKRAIEFDKRVKRPYQNVLNYFKYEGINRKKLLTAKDNMDMAASFYERNVLGEVQEIKGHLEVFGAKIDPNKTLIAASIWSSLSMLGFSPRIGVRSALGVNLEMLTKSFAHQMTGSNYFKPKDWAAGIGELVQNRHKVIAINEEVMKIVNMDERSLLTHRHNLASKNHALQDDTAHLMIWYGEYGARLTSMIAHMIHEGSWKAYSFDSNGELDYDERKDDRFYKDGKITEFGKKLKAATKLELQKVGGKWYAKQKASDAIHGPDGPLVIGHSWRDGENVKAQSDILYSQGMTSDTKSMLANVVIAQPFMQFSTYLVNKAHLWTQKPYRNNKLGQWIEDPDDPTRAKWEGREMKGFIYTISDSINLLRTHKSFNGVWQKLSETDKNNLLYAATDVMFLTLFALLIGILLSGDDDEEKELSPTADFVLNKVIGDAIREKNVNIMFPRELYNKIENPIVMNQLVKAPFETMFALGDFENEAYIEKIIKEGSFMIPGGSLIRELMPFLEQHKEAKAKGND